MTKSGHHSDGEIGFIIYRDIGEGHFLNRICKEEGTDEIKYYCEVDNQTLHLTVHKGGLAGPVIATAILSSTKNGATEIKLTQTHHTLLQTHVSGFFSGKTFFEIDGKKFHWKGQSALVEDDTGVCIAVYKAKSFESEDRKLGTLLVTALGQQYVDIIVVSTLVEQERNDESEFDRLEFSKEGGDVFFDKTMFIK